MKIVHIFPKDKGGLFRYAHRLIEELKDYYVENVILNVSLEMTQNREIEIEVCKDNNIEIYKVNNINKDIRDPLYQCRDKSVEEAFVKLINKIQPDIVHFQGLLGIPYSLIQIMYMKGIKTILTLHDTYSICYKLNFLIKSGGKECFSPLNGFACSDCSGLEKNAENIHRYNYALTVMNQYTDAIIGVSEYVSDIHKINGLAKQINIVRSGIDIPLMMEEKRIQVPINILYVGGLSYQKGFLILLESLRGIPSDKYKLNIYGVGNRNHYDLKIRPYYSELNMEFHGMYSYSETVEIFDSNDLLVIPSIGSESAPLAVQEALARRVPCIVSSAGGIKEYVIEGVTGYIFKKGDISQLNFILNRLLDNPEEITILSNNMVEVPIRTFKNVAEDYFEIYSEILKKERNFIIESISDQYYENCDLSLLSFMEGVVEKTISYINKSYKEYGTVEELYIFGTGQIADWVENYLDKKNINIVGYFDNSTDKIGKIRNGLKIEQPYFISGIKVLIASSFSEEMKQQLLDLLYEENDIILGYR